MPDQFPECRVVSKFIMNFLKTDGIVLSLLIIIIKQPLRSLLDLNNRPSELSALHVIIGSSYAEVTIMSVFVIKIHPNS
jgi:hypothetical protein